MSEKNRSYRVQVQSDYLNKITRADPVQALEELIWNSLDADATTVEVHLEYNDLDTLSAIIVSDNGFGMPYSEAPGLFQNLGGSWKRLGGRTKKEGRFLHGQDGRGRFKALALGLGAEWEVTYEKGAELWTYKIKITADDIQEVVISEEKPAPAQKRRGVLLTITEPHRDFKILTSDEGIQALNETFALYLTDYPAVSIQVDTKKLNPTSVIATRHFANLSDIVEGGKHYPVRLSVIEWKTSTNRSFYLCNERRLPLIRVSRRLQAGNFQFSAYLSSDFITKFQKENTLDFCESNPFISKALLEAVQNIKDYFRERAAQEAKTLVEEWKEERIYPYESEAATQVDRVERQVFDIVAVNVARYMPDFASTPAKSKALHLRLLRHAMEQSPEELQFILEEVLKLPKRKQAELADLLRNVSLSAIISAAKVVADRLKFLDALESILFDAEFKKHLKERSQLHGIIAQNCWLFGEEYNLSVNDQSLTEVLRKHKKLIGEDVIIDEPVKHITKTTGIVDLMVSRAIRCHRANELTHLVVELKAPKVKVDRKEIPQIEEYAFSIMEDERFRNLNTRWVFWVISDDFGDYAKNRIQDSSGLIHQKNSISIFVKTWAQVINENRARLQFFQEKLEYQADKGASIKHLRDHYEEFIQGVITVEEIETQDDVETETTT
ncbi:ATP-binding protein [Desulfuromonas sp. AOP6]|uniref:ATP-binding protein n=1 Tax=Desulfuromonas sp. AOP6 TaxID=1566351 RepID=UPI001287D64B|nr:ATP-binding protein [Desulfuromonas sp. AOP6]BCA79055.1 hypothetical protein AOP6_0842 [Desulfuromonas sp. AOP6]